MRVKEKIIIASDHAGFELKNILIEYLKGLDYEVKDFGPFVYNFLDDYPDFISPAAKTVSMDPKNLKGIFIGGSGEGEAMVANRFPLVRAAVYYGGSLQIVKLSREHNDANVLAVGARFIEEKDAKEAVKIWLETKFMRDERHLRRIKKIDKN